MITYWLRALVHKLKASRLHFVSFIMVMKTMKAMKAGGKTMSKGALTTTLATEHEMKPKQVKGIIESLVSVGAAEIKKNGIFTIPGLCRIKTRVKPARKAGKRMAFGKEVTVKAQPAKTVVKVFPVAALKSQI